MAGYPEAWGDSLINCGLMAAAVILAILSLPEFVETFPYILKGLTRDKPLISLEDNLRLRLQRNNLSFTAMAFFCLTASMFGMISFGFASNYSSGVKTLVNIGMFLLYYLLRIMLAHAFRREGSGKEFYRAGNRMYNNVMIVLVTFMAVTIGICGTLDVDAAAIRSILIHETLLAAIVLAIRKVEIFTGFCNPFRAFLYLCGLEIFPAGMLVAAAILF